MKFIDIFLAFFIPGIVGYGGGPASIPLIEYEVVYRYGWLTVDEFAEVLALGNALPGPIATKMAAHVGYIEGGLLGAAAGLFATIAPSLALMIFLLGILYKYRNSPKVKKMTMLIRPTIAVLLGVLAYRFFESAYDETGWLVTVILVVVSFVLLEKVKIHPALVISGALVFGAFFL